MEKRNATTSFVMRLDRSLSQSRQSSCSIGIIGEASGSGRYKLGRTVATSVIYGPSTPKYGRHEDYRSMNVEVVYSTSLGGGSGAGDAAVGAGNDLKRAEREGSRFIRAGLLGAIDITRCPRSLLVVKVAVDFDDGNSLCAAFNASVIALMNAGIRMNYVPVAVGVAHLLLESTMAATVFTAASKINQGNVVEETQSQGEVQGKVRMLCVDPEKEEEDSVCANFQFVMRVPSAPSQQQQQQEMEVDDDDNNNNNSSSSGERKKAVVVLHTRCKGSFTQTQLAQAGALAAKAAVGVISFFKTVDF